MSDRVFVLGVGGPAGFNVASAAKDAGYAVTGVDSRPGNVPLALKACDEVLVTERVPEQAIGEVVLPQPEALVRQCAVMASSGHIKYHGPSLGVLSTLADKEEACRRWYDAGLRSTLPVRVADPIPDHLHIAKERLGLPFWLRAGSGAGARGAILVSDLREAYHWVRLHEVRFGMFGQFIAELYLPGSDFCWTALYHEGERVASFSRERLEWLYPRLAPFSGRTGTPTLSRVTHYRYVRRVGEEAVAAIDPRPHGVYCVDMREDPDDHPQPTEINAGRWATTSPLYRAFGANLVAAHIRLANGDHVDPPGDDCYPDGAELHRHIDMGMAAVPGRGWGL